MCTLPFLFFDGRCEEAVEFYRVALGAKITLLTRFIDGPGLDDKTESTPNAEQGIMHARFRVGDIVVMASDGLCPGSPSMSKFALPIVVHDDELADRIFHKLAAGGQIRMPLCETFFSSSFGMVDDRFGVSWIVIVAI